MSPPYRVDHNGSLLRPTKLLEARAAVHSSADSMEEGTPEQEAHIKAVTEECVHELVEQELKHGITTITSGEFERNVFWNGLYEGLSGLSLTFIPFETGKWRPGFPINERMIRVGWKGRMGREAVGKIKRVKSPHMDSWLLLRSCLPREQWQHAKVNIISPTWFLEMMEKPYLPDSGYVDDKEYLKDISDALREEVMDLYDHGLRNVQIDDPLLSMFYTEDWEPILRKQGTDIEGLIDLYIWTHNNFLKGLPDDLNVIHHMCRGNIPGAPTLVGGYNKLVKKLFNDCNYRLFNLEWDSPEHGDFSPLSHLPAGKSVILGLISTKTAELEDVEALKRRLHEAADVIAVARGISREAALDQQLAVSPQCGFSTTHQTRGIGMDIEKQWGKMNILQRLAEEVWPGWRTKSGLAKL